MYNRSIELEQVMWTMPKHIEFSTLISAPVDAVRRFHEKRAKTPDAVLFDELEMNARGYSYLQSDRFVEAISLFKLNTIAYPQSSNAHDSLGEAYLKNGQKALAITHYERSLELNPNNANARSVLEEIRKDR